MIALCGGNIDTTVLGRCIDRGLAADGRLVKFSVTVSDRPGGIAELAKYERVTFFNIRAEIFLPLVSFSIGPCQNWEFPSKTLFTRGHGLKMTFSASK